MLVGAVIASILFIIFGFFILIEFENPKPKEFDDSLIIKINPVTENLKIYDTEANTTIFWTPGNPVVLPVKVKKIAPNRWVAEFEQPLPE